MGLLFLKHQKNDMFYWSIDNARMIFFTKNRARMQTAAAGETYIEILFVVGNSEANPNLQMGTINCNNIGVSKPAGGSFSTSAPAGDMGTCYTTTTYPITLQSTSSTNQTMSTTYATAVPTSLLLINQEQLPPQLRWEF